MRNVNGIVFAMASIGWCGVGWAAAQGASTAISPAGDQIKTGDRFGLKAEATIFRSVDSSPGDAADSGPFCAPAGTIFRVDGVDQSQTKITGTKKDANNNDVSVDPVVQTDEKIGTTTTTLAGATTVEQKQTDNVLHLHIIKSPINGFWNSLIGVSPGSYACLKNPEKLMLNPSNQQPKPEDHNEQVVVRREYTTTVTELGRYGFYRNGWTWGALTIPYKYEFTDHSFQAKPTVAAYAGFETWVAGADSASVVAIGIGGASATTQTTTTSITSKTSTSTSGGGTLALYTLAIGQLFSLGSSGSFKGGVLVGKDWAGASAGYKYEGRTWLAVTFGTGF